LTLIAARRRAPPLNNILAVLNTELNFAADKKLIEPIGKTGLFKLQRPEIESGGWNLPSTRASSPPRKRKGRGGTPPSASPERRAFASTKCGRSGDIGDPDDPAQPASTARATGDDAARGASSRVALRSALFPVALKVWYLSAKVPLLRAIGQNIWLRDGPVVRAYGLPFPTRMAVVRLDGGELWIWSPIQLDDDLRHEVMALGEPRFAVEPNKLHHLALAQWIAAWPSLRCWAPPGLAEKRRDLRFDGDLTDEEPAEWRGQIDQLLIRGSFFMTEVFFFHRRSRTCLVGDLVQRHDPASLTGWQRWMMSGCVGPDGGTGWDARLSFVRRRRARACITRAIDWAPRQVVIAHGALPTGDGAEELRRSFRWLLY
jgi:hypothetical protein